MKRFLSVLTSIVICVMLFCVQPTAAAYNFDIDFETASDTLYLVNMDTNTVIYSKNADEIRYPASTTKIMTYIITAEHVDDILNTMVDIKYDIIHMLDNTGSSLSGLDEYIGKKLSVYDILHCLMVKSGNDAAMVLADYVGGGSISEFVDMMNKKAKELGCKNTNFVNPHGLHDSNHYTTAEDLKIITEYAMELPYFMEICGTATYYLPDSDYPLVATNSLIDSGRGGDYYYSYATGIKTGTTDEAGFCLVSTATKGGYTYMCIALKAPCYDSKGEWMTTNGAMTDSVNLFKWAFSNLEYKTVLKEDTPVCTVNLELAWNKDSIVVSPEKSFSTILPESVDISSIDIIPEVPESIKAPVTQGSIVGKAKISYANQELATVNLVASETVMASEMLQITTTVKSIISSYWVIIPVCIVIVLFIIYLIVATVYSKRLEHKIENSKYLKDKTQGK